MLAPDHFVHNDSNEPGNQRQSDNASDQDPDQLWPLKMPQCSATLPAAFDPIRQQVHPRVRHVATFVLPQQLARMGDLHGQIGESHASTVQKRALGFDRCPRRTEVAAVQRPRKHNALGAQIDGKLGM
jgi:hypothetical protein